MPKTHIQRFCKVGKIDEEVIETLIWTQELGGTHDELPENFWDRVRQVTRKMFREWIYEHTPSLITDYDKDKSLPMYAKQTLTQDLRPKGLSKYFFTRRHCTSTVVEDFTKGMYDKSATAEVYSKLVDHLLYTSMAANVHKRANVSDTNTSYLPYITMRLLDATMCLEKEYTTAANYRRTLDTVTFVINMIAIRSMKMLAAEPKTITLKEARHVAVMDTKTHVQFANFQFFPSTR
jgi:hypothetical protein